MSVGYRRIGPDPLPEAYHLSELIRAAGLWKPATWSQSIAFYSGAAQRPLLYHTALASRINVISATLGMNI